MSAKSHFGTTVRRATIHGRRGESCQGNPTYTEKEWTRVLSTVLLGLRAHVRADTDASPAEFLFGTTIRLLGEFFLPEDFTPNPNIFLEEFRERMHLVNPVPVMRHDLKRPFFFKDLKTCTNVFLRNVANKSLECPYAGPYKIMKRISDAICDINVNGSVRSISQIC